MLRVMFKVLTWAAVFGIVLIDLIRQRPEPHSWPLDSEAEASSHAGHTALAQKALTRGT